MTILKQFGEWDTNSKSHKSKNTFKSDKSPLFWQLFICLMLLVMGLFMVCIVFNSTFLERYYSLEKRKQMTSAYEKMDQAAVDGTLSGDAFDETFSSLCDVNNINMIVIGEDRSIIRSSLRDFTDLQMQIINILLEKDNNSLELLEETDSYYLAEEKSQGKNKGYLVLLGTLSDGSTLYMRTALESIQESAALTNRFFRMVCFAAMFLCAIVIFFISRSISRPLQELTTLSRRMTDLDFDARYVSGKYGSEEIDELGFHMNEMSDSLERTISELKTANLELKKDIEKKEAIDEMRKEFLSNVSHELKTPLALISGYAEGLQEGVNDDPESRDFYCEVIVDEAGKMNRMVKKLLTLNSLEFGSESLEILRFDINELFKGVIGANALQCQQKNIKLVYDDKSPIQVWGDEFNVEEVVTNYLSNAINHIDGERLIEIRAELKGDLYRFSVFNTGTPIPEEDLDKIWIKFYKVDKARTREYGGSGIGLSIVKAIMDSMHRECGVINHENGVEFWFELEKA